MSREQEEVRLVNGLAERMLHKLRENRDKKPHWHEQTLDGLIVHFREEVEELYYELFTDDPINPEAVALEAADVANTAAMIADRLEPFSARPQDEGDRWTERVKLLELRANRAISILTGEEDG